MSDRKPKPVRAWAVVTIMGNIVRGIEGTPMLSPDRFRAENWAHKHLGERVIRVLITPETPDA